jgi:hypothetical protein
MAFSSDDLKGLLESTAAILPVRQLPLLHGKSTAYLCPDLSVFIKQDRETVAAVRQQKI